jgi:GNAT superfamily N-acetyltransferase
MINNNFQVEIRIINSNFIEPVLCLLNNVVKHMLENNIQQWDEIYPSKEIISADMDGGSAFGLFINDKLSGYVALNSEQSPEYSIIPSKDINGKILVIHRLFIDPKEQKKGLGKKLLNFAELYGKENLFSSIRFDAFSQNKTATHLYEKNKYNLMGTVTYRKGKFYCYEKSLKD